MKISQQDMRWMALAVQVAEESDCKQRVGAVLVSKGSVTARANRKRRFGGDTFPWSIHAESHVLKDRGRSGGRIYIARITPGGKFGLAKPCPRCAVELIEAGVNRAVWTTDDGFKASKIRDLSTDLIEYYGDEYVRS